MRGEGCCARLVVAKGSVFPPDSYLLCSVFRSYTLVFLPLAQSFPLILKSEDMDEANQDAAHAEPHPRQRRDDVVRAVQEMRLLDGAGRRQPLLDSAAAAAASSSSSEDEDAEGTQRSKCTEGEREDTRPAHSDAAAVAGDLDPMPKKREKRVKNLGRLESLDDALLPDRKGPRTADAIDDIFGDF